VTALASERLVGSSLTTFASPPPAPTSLITHTERSPEPLVILWPKTGARPWYIDLTERELNRLIGLDEGWDGYRAQPVTFEALRTTIEVLGSLLTEQSPRPQFFPLPDGGIQVEWLVNGNSAVIEVDGAGEAYVLATTREGSEVVDGIISRQTPDMTRWVKKFLSALAASLEQAH
jgi:hypothetical protein